MPIRVITSATGTPFEDRVRWIVAKNVSGEVIPSHAVCRVVDAEGGGTLHVSKPTQDSQECVINSAFSIPVGGYGRVTRETPARILISDGESEPVEGDEWGAGAGDWGIQPGKLGFEISGEYLSADQTILATRKTIRCRLPIAFRIDGGDAVNGYEWTSMQQVAGSPAEWEEADDGLTNVTTGVMAYEANGTEVVAGTTIFHGIYDACRGEAFFFGSEFPKRAIVEFLESTPSFGELYSAKIFVELVDTSGAVSWTPGTTVWAFPINNVVPTLETLYFADRTEDEEEIGGVAIYKVDRCCDSAVNQSSSGGSVNPAGIMGAICYPPGSQLRVMVAHSSLATPQEYLLDWNSGSEIYENNGNATYDAGGTVSLSVICTNGLASPTLYFTLTNNSAIGVEKGTGVNLSWSTPSDWAEGENYLFIVTEYIP